MAIMHNHDIRYTKLNIYNVLQHCHRNTKLWTKARPPRVYREKGVGTPHNLHSVLVVIFAQN